MKCILIGAGARGMIYGRWAVAHGIQITGVAERRPDRLRDAGTALNVPEDRLFSDASQLLAQGRLADAAIIATMDRDHYGHTMQALALGYDILLEKPISPDPRECLAIEAEATRLNRKVTVCHVMRYTNLFSALKKIVDSGEVGRIISIQHTENIGNFHMAHSFVRGNWRNSKESSCLILQKSCHDLDMLLWLVGRHCTRVASFGSLTYFRPENAPEGAADRCLGCPCAGDCRFDARKAYLPALGCWPTDMVSLEQTEEAVLEALRTGPYGRCVFHCDNDVCDHMSTILEFEGGATATFSLSGQTNRCHRDIHIMCEHGEILADDDTNLIEIRSFASNNVEPCTSRLIHPGAILSGHGGGDGGLMEDFAAGKADRTSIAQSIESHLMAMAAEESRLTGRVIRMDEFRASLQ